MQGVSVVRAGGVQTGCTERVPSGRSTAKKGRAILFLTMSVIMRGMVEGSLRQILSCGGRQGPTGRRKRWDEYVQGWCGRAPKGGVGGEAGRRVHQQEQDAAGVQGHQP